MPQFEAITTSQSRGDKNFKEEEEEEEVGLML